MSNTIGTVTYAASGSPNSRTVELFINFKDNSHLDDEGFAPFATVVGAEGMKTAVAIHNPTPNNTMGVDQEEYATKGNEWIRQAYPGINVSPRPRCAAALLLACDSVLRLRAVPQFIKGMSCGGGTHIVPPPPPPH